MKNVLLIDSGSGGINILKECLRVCPNGNFLMFCDNKNLPYGSKSNDFLIDETLRNLKEIRKSFEFDVVVIACNTLTSACIDSCRESFADVEFVGTVPAIKVALGRYREDEIVVLGTEVTIKYNKLISKFPNIRCKMMPDLATLIDEHLDDLSMIEGYLRAELGGLDAKALVLGCTHYVAVKDMIEEILPGVSVFDSANGVARRLKSILGEECGGYSVKIVTSQNDDMWAKLWHYFVSG